MQGTVSEMSKQTLRDMPERGEFSCRVEEVVQIPPGPDRHAERGHLFERRLQVLDPGPELAAVERSRAYRPPAVSGSRYAVRAAPD